MQYHSAIQFNHTWGVTDGGLQWQHKQNPIKKIEVMDVKGCDDEAPFSKHKTRLLNCTVRPHCTNAPGASTYHQPQPHPAERNTVTVRNKNSRSERNTNSSQPMKIYYSDPAVGTMLFATLCSDEQNMNPNRGGMFPEILGGPRQTGTHHTSPLPSKFPQPLTRIEFVA